MAPLADFLSQVLPFPEFPAKFKQFIPGETPLSTTPAVLSALAAYLAIIFGTQAFMRNREPLVFKPLFRAHNAFLSLGSLLLLLLMSEEIAVLIWNDGFYSAMCNSKSWTPHLETYYLINYAFKYIELADTVFLALKKKPLAFLHVFHHSATALLCYSQLLGRTSVSWVVITLNLAVHVIMYYYYYATAGGAKIWWKKYLTSMQIIQFIVDLFIVYFATYSFYASHGHAYLPHLGECTGTQTSALFGCGLLTSYLFLFIKFYFDTYKKPRTAGKQSKVPADKINGNGWSH